MFTLRSFKIDVFPRLRICDLKINVSWRASVNFQHISPLDAALTMRFAKNEPQDTSEVLHLPCEMTMMVSKVLRLPRKMQLIV